MSIEFYRSISMISFISAGLMFILSVVLFFRLNIIKAFGDVTGKTARKAIRNIYEQNSQSGSKRHKSRPSYIERRKAADKVYSSGNPVPKNCKTSANTAMKKNKLKNMQNEYETTTLLDDKLFTAVQYDDSCKNSLSGITESLEELSNVNTPDEEINRQFELELDITYINTDEVIL